MKQVITHARLHDLLDYIPSLGRFVWKARPVGTFKTEGHSKRWHGRFTDKQAGSQSGSGYRKIQIDNRHYLEHRLVWMYFHKTFPEMEIDHINGDKTDNRIENLRHVSSVKNNQNKKLPFHNTSGVIGVAPARSRDKWLAHIKVGDENIYLGTYETIELAAAARRGAEKVAGYHPNHGRRTG